MAGSDSSTVTAAASGEAVGIMGVGEKGDVSVAVGVLVCDGVSVSVTVGVLVCDGVSVSVTVGVCVCDGVSVSVAIGGTGDTGRVTVVGCTASVATAANVTSGSGVFELSSASAVCVK